MNILYLKPDGSTNIGNGTEDDENFLQLHMDVQVKWAHKLETRTNNAVFRKSMMWVCPVETSGDKMMGITNISFYDPEKTIHRVVFDINRYDFSTSIDPDTDDSITDHPTLHGYRRVHWRVLLDDMCIVIPQGMKDVSIQLFPQDGSVFTNDISVVYDVVENIEVV